MARSRIFSTPWDQDQLSGYASFVVALSLGSPARRVVGARDGNDHSARKLLLQLDIVEGSSRKRFSLSSRLSAIRRQCSQEVVLRHKRIPVDLAMLTENPDFSLKPCSEMEDKMTEQESEVIGSAGLQLSRRTRADDRYQRGAGIPHRRGCSQSGRLSSRARFIAAHALPHFVPLLRSLIRSMAQRS